MQAAAFIQRDDRAEVEARSSDIAGEAEPLVVEFSQRLHRAVMEDKCRTLSACRNHPDIAETVHSALTVTVFAAGNDRTVSAQSDKMPAATGNCGKSAPILYLGKPRFNFFIRKQSLFPHAVGKQYAAVLPENNDIRSFIAGKTADISATIGLDNLFVFLHFAGNMQYAVFVNPVKRLIKIDKPFWEVVHQLHGGQGFFLRRGFSGSAALHKRGKAFGRQVEFLFLGFWQRFICKRRRHRRIGALCYGFCCGTAPTIFGSFLYASVLLE